jgi:hypothetical protein
MATKLALHTLVLDCEGDSNEFGNRYVKSSSPWSLLFCVQYPQKG